MKKKLLTTLLLSCGILMIIPLIAHAYQIPQEYTPINTPFGLENETAEANKDDPAKYTITILQTLAGGLLFFVAPITVIILVIAGLRLMAGGTESEGMETAKKQITWALLGLILTILSYSIVRVIIEISFKAGNVEVPTS